AAPVAEAGVVRFFVGPVVGHRYLLNVQKLTLSAMMNCGINPAVGSREMLKLRGWEMEDKDVIIARAIGRARHQTGHSKSLQSEPAVHLQQAPVQAALAHRGCLQQVERLYAHRNPL